jgi:hypothetical protein
VRALVSVERDQVRYGIVVTSPEHEAPARWVYGAELTCLGLFTGRAGYIHDPGADIKAWTYGLGFGGKFKGPGGLRLDFASVPDVYDRSTRYSITAWLGR